MSIPMTDTISEQQLPITSIISICYSFMSDRITDVGRAWPYLDKLIEEHVKNREVLALYMICNVEVSFSLQSYGISGDTYLREQAH